MKLRSLLFVPGDSERKFARAKDCGADALILDLEDFVAPSRKAAARAMVAELVGRNDKRDWSFFVRVNALETGLTLDDMAAVVKSGLDALLIPKANGASDIERVGQDLDGSRPGPACREARSNSLSWRRRRPWRCSLSARTRRPIPGSSP